MGRLSEAACGWMPAPWERGGLPLQRVSVRTRARPPETQLASMRPRPGPPETQLTSMRPSARLRPGAHYNGLCSLGRRQARCEGQVSLVAAGVSPSLPLTAQASLAKDYLPSRLSLSNAETLAFCGRCPRSPQAVGD